MRSMKSKAKERMGSGVDEPTVEAADSQSPASYSDRGSSEKHTTGGPMEESTGDAMGLRSIVRGVIEEFVQAEQAKAEPAYKAELLDEKKRREHLERRVDELIQENRRSRELAEEA